MVKHPPYSMYLKWAISIMVPAGLMFLFFTQTRLNQLLVFLLGIALCAGFLFLFRLVYIPGSEMERQVLNEEALLRTLAKTREQLEIQATLTQRLPIILEVEKLSEILKELAMKMAADDRIDLQLPNRINIALMKILSAIKTCNDTKSKIVELPEVEERLDSIEANLLPRTYMILTEIYREYAAGRLSEVDIQLNTLDSLLNQFGYLPRM